jgi:hypothetical protein
MEMHFSVRKKVAQVHSMPFWLLHKQGREANAADEA